MATGWEYPIALAGTVGLATVVATKRSKKDAAIVGIGLLVGLGGSYLARREWLIRQVVAATPANRELVAKVFNLAWSVGMSPVHLARLIHWETDGTWDYRRRTSDGIHASGLIGITDNSARKLGTTTIALTQMPLADQLSLLKVYFNRVTAGKWEGPKGRLGKKQETYMSVFYPKYRYVDPNTRFPSNVLAAGNDAQTPQMYIDSVDNFARSRGLP